MFGFYFIFPLALFGVCVFLFCGEQSTCVPSSFLRMDLFFQRPFVLFLVGGGAR